MVLFYKYPPDWLRRIQVWFIRRLPLTFILVIVIAFSMGVLFALYWSRPLSESQIYLSLTSKANLAQYGIRTYSQQVIDTASPVFHDLVLETRDSDIVINNIPQRKEKLKEYLASKGSPFAQDEAALDAFANSRNMRLMVAISFVESTFGKHCYYYNCSGIGGTPPNLRKYSNYSEWIQDFDSLLERRYKNLPVEQFIGLYVQPGSPNWINGVRQVLREFKDQGIDA